MVEGTNKAEIRPEEQSEKVESCRENLWNKIQLKGLVRWCFEPSQPQRITSGLSPSRAGDVAVNAST